MLKKLRNNINELVLKATYKAQKKYGFEIGTGEHATWNNEADAFKHAYMQWYLSQNSFPFAAKFVGDWHENIETPNAPEGERNMDLWNNQIGREIAEEMKKKYGKVLDGLTEEAVSDIASRIIVEKMHQGELITNPNDKRRYENMDLERLRAEDRVYSIEELESMDERTKSKVWDNQVKHFSEGNWGVPYESHLKEAAKSGDLIYVKSYTRSDGTTVSGYYRKRR